MVACVAAAVPSHSSSAGWICESVADAENRQNKTRRTRVRLDLSPDVLDVSVDRPLVRLECHPSHSVQQLPPREYPSRLPRHGSHHLKLRLVQIDASAGDSGFHPRYVKLNGPTDSAHDRV